MAATTRTTPANVESLAMALSRMGPMWSTAGFDPAAQAALPTMLLSAVVVDDGQVAEFVAKPALAPIISLFGVPGDARVKSSAVEYTVRFSA
mgnify:CR=1 FL=1